MRSSTFTLSLLASLAIAQPHKQVHQHAKQHEARDAAPVEWVTEYEYTTEVVPVTKTIWVSEGYVAPSQTAKATVPAQFFQPKNNSKSKKVKASSTLVKVVTIAPAPVSTSSAQSTTTTAPPSPPPAAEVVDTTSTTTTQAPAPKVEESAPKVEESAAKVEESAPKVEASAPEPTTTQAPAPESTTTTQAPKVETPAPSAAAPVENKESSASSSTSSSGSTGGACPKGSSCEGDMTYYDTGLGACGWTNDGETEDVVALSHLLMGTQSNGNPFCGQSITIKHGGKSIVAKVVDKCMGCEIHAIDLSNHAFKQLEDQGVGRTQAEWYFN